MRINPIDIIKDMSGKVCTHSNIHIALNSSSGKMYTSKKCHPYEGAPTAAQLSQQQSFKTLVTYASAWLNANKPSETNGANGTAAYQEAIRLKKQLQLSSIIQVVYKYMDATTGTVTLPSGSTSTPTSGDAY